MLVKALIAGVFALCVFTSCGGRTAGGPGTGGGQGPTAYCASAKPDHLPRPARGEHPGRPLQPARIDSRDVYDRLVTGVRIASSAAKQRSTSAVSL
jgi:hypothetical protein